jgi:putative endonuclease
MSDENKRTYRQRIGEQGEENAVHFLKAKGYRILERNYRWERGEIDIIAQDGDVLVFVEVKTMAHEGFGSPESWVDRRKQEQIGRVAAGYLLDTDQQEVNCRFDVVAITQGRNRREIRHLEDAFWLESDETERLI